MEFALPEEAPERLTRAEAMIPEHVRVDGAFLERAPRLRLVQTGAGYDHVDLAACTRRGVWVCNAPGINAAAVAEHTMALLAFYKNVPYLDSFMKQGREERGLCYAGGGLAGKTVGVVGTGHIGARVAACCRTFGMEVLGYSRRNRGGPGIEPAGLEELLRRRDEVSLHVSLTEQTRGLIGAGELARMKPTAVLINTTRGGVVDKGALVDALKGGQIAGACLDVYEQEPLPAASPLRGLKNVILTPHTAGLPDGIRFDAERYRFFAENIRRVQDGQVPEHALNTV